MRHTKFLTTTAIILALTTSAHAEHINIIQLGEGNFTTMGSPNISISGQEGTTIQAALNVIPDGGTITISGDFKLTKTLQIGKNVTLRSASTSHLYGDNSFGLADLQGNITLEGLTFEQGCDNICGGGLYITGAGSVTLKNCVIRQCLAGCYGGGLYITGAGSVTLKNCVIRQCLAGCYGGGVLVSPGYSGTLEMIDCEVDNNAARGRESKGYGFGGGLCVFAGSLVMRNCYVHDNYAYYYGGGIVVRELAAAGADAQCVISGNTSTAYPQFSDIYNASQTVTSSSLGDVDVEVSHSQSGCNASGLGLVLLAAVFTFRRKSVHAQA